MALTEGEARCRDAHQKMVGKYVTLRDHIVKSLGCSNCGEPAGYECRHDHGCVDVDRNVPRNRLARGAPASRRRRRKQTPPTTKTGRDQQ